MVWLSTVSRDLTVSATTRISRDSMPLRSSIFLKSSRMAKLSMNSRVSRAVLSFAIRKLSSASRALRVSTD